jgi:hypothetical protein
MSWQPCWQCHLPSYLTPGILVVGNDKYGRLIPGLYQMGPVLQHSEWAGGHGEMEVVESRRRIQHRSEAVRQCQPR